MSAKPDGRSTTLKPKQVALLDLFRAHGPISVRALTPRIHGDDDRIHRIMVSNQVKSLSRRGLIKPASVGAREHGDRGTLPFLWVACGVQA